MKSIYLIISFFIIPIVLKAQLINDGGEVYIASNSTVIWESSIENNSTTENSGHFEIQGDGELQIEGDLINNANLQMDLLSTIIFNGEDPSHLTSGNATLSNVIIDKTANDLVLLDLMQISSNLNFSGDNNKVNLNGNNITFGSSATVSSADENEYIVVDNNVFVTKEFTFLSDFTYEIGTTDGKYTPLNLDLINGTNPLSIEINTESIKHPDVPVQSTDFINRFWNINVSNENSFEAIITGTYDISDLPTGVNNSNIKGAFYDNSDWSYVNSSNSGYNITADITSSGDFTGSNIFGKVGLKAFLEGPLIANNLMSTTLNSSNLIPLTSPFDGVTTVSSIPNNVTDWIEVELRDVASPNIVLSSHSAFIRNDGVILNLDGSPNVLITDSPSQAYIGLNHRNHLSINSSVPLDLDYTNFETHDFSTSQSQAYNDPSIINNNAMSNISMNVGENLYGLFRGDANNNNVINVIDVAITTSGSVPIQNNVYLGIDVNLNGVVNVIDVAITRNASIPIKSAHTY